MKSKKWDYLCRNRINAQHNQLKRFRYLMAFVEKRQGKHSDHTWSRNKRCSSARKASCCVFFFCLTNDEHSQTIAKASQVRHQVHQNQKLRPGEEHQKLGRYNFYFNKQKKEPKS